MHGPRQPTWEYYDDFMNWTARVQYIGQSGIPKIDLAFWLKKNEFFDKDSQYHPNDLVADGLSRSSYKTRTLLICRQVGHMNTSAQTTSLPNQRRMSLMAHLPQLARLSKL
jgi:hypothetical protein